MASTPAASRPCRTARSGRSRRATTKRRGRRTAATSSKFSPAVTRCGSRRRRALSRHVAFVLSLGLAAGCALKGDVRKVELQVAALKADAARADADRAAQIDSVLKLLAAVQQAVAAQQAYLVQFRGDVRTDLVGVQQQLVTVQELTGQSQQRLSELRARIEERAQQPVPALYKLGLVAEARGDKKAARTYYARVVAGYPRSDEANLARDKLQRLGR